MDAMTENHCPVCGYDLGFPAWDSGSPSDEICPCCGIQFGYDDAAGGEAQLRRQTYDKWRADWVADGMPWRSAGIRRPENWEPRVQLNAIGGDMNGD